MDSRTGRAILVVLLATYLATSPLNAQYENENKPCRANSKCVRNDLCRNGKIDRTGGQVIEPRFLNVDAKDECKSVALTCCEDANVVTNDSDESYEVVPPPTSSTTEEPDENWNQQCGERDVRIQESDSDESITNRWEFPWSVALFRIQYLLGVKMEFLCGGSLIDDYVVVTAARCVQGKNISSLVVALGRWDLYDTQEPRTQQIPVESVIIHRNYSPSSYVNNIALVVLKRNADLGRAVNRVCLPDRSVIFNENAICNVVGWSTSPPPSRRNQQLKLKGMIANARDCTVSIVRATGSLKYALPAQNLCSVFHEEDVPCERAPGSGMVCWPQDTTGPYFLVGIASYSVRNCNQFKANDVFLRTADYIGWIDEHITKLERQTNFYRPDEPVNDEDGDDSDSDAF